MWWEMFSCNINSQCCRNMNMIIICVGWWSHLHADWLPHVLISCNVQPHHKWQLTLWQDFCMRSRAELGRGTPARYLLMIHWLWLNTKHGPDWHLSREGFLWLLAGWSYLSQILIVITTHKVILSYPPNSYIYRLGSFGLLQTWNLSIYYGLR